MANFRTRARAVDLLGKQQIRDEVTSISELLRNSYDADADHGSIIINSKQDYIIVSDDGDGMSREDIEQKWLTIGTHSKTNKKTVVTKKGRVKIGEKGIGRLAISLLGDQLLLISKKDFKWTILYLHWELFRNESIFLEDIALPVKTFEDFETLYHFLSKDTHYIKKELSKNLNNLDNWDLEKRSIILNKIDLFSISSEAIQELFKIEQKGHGTLFYVSDLEKEWDWDAYNAKTNGRSMKRKTRRLKDSLYAFTNIFKYYDPKIKNEDVFTPSIQINGINLTDETFFTEEDLKNYDYSIEGIIINGEFTGTMRINQKDGDPPQVFEENNLKITEGLDRNLFKDCGPIEIKWFFVEGTSTSSSLEKDIHKNMTKKLNNIGGIYVFRDGLRILPYGEPGNDFLELEARRTENAGMYLFSHRRMFGYIEISKIKNNKLTDKSSREGFVENTYYHYFREVNMNLLIWWARTFLETRQDNGKRGIRLKKLKAEEDKRKAREAEEKEQNKQIKKLLKKLNGYTFNLEKESEKTKKALNNLLNKLNKDTILVSSNPYEKLNSLRHEIKDTALRTISSFEKDLTLEFNERYELDNSIQEEIYFHKQELNKVIQRLNDSFQKDLESRMEILETIIKEISISDNFKIQEVKKQMDKLQNKLSQVPYWIEKEKRASVDIINDKFISSTASFNKEVNHLVNNYFNDFNFLQNTMREKEKAMFHISSLLQSLEHSSNTAKYNEIVQKLYAIDKELNGIKESLSEKRLRLQNDTEFRKIIKKVEELNKYIFQDTGDDKLIGLLKREVEMYRDISAVGLAAELTSHEFNALYQNIKRNFKILNSKLSKTALNPIVVNTYNAFDSLEKLHQRMSPLYRQSRSRKSNIYLYEFIEKTAEYFKNDIERYKIKIINDIPKDFKIMEAEPILFTPLINLFSNAIYWLMDRESRILHFYTDDHYSKLYIHDSGPGISQYDSTYLFEPFYSKRMNGRGLGLYLSRDILQTKGHNLSFIPSEKALISNHGACFCITFNKKTIEGELG
ncbi:ATP-binding protein [Bacillus amyloliquefaciens]|uniref:sensor histidine kinase n=1 Tax=Bacillus velezensis TaxID=492670 RepID=UPI001ABE1EE0|nr:sensor histidine kinase [Bacillus velezensis]MBO3790956.1 ATP-binding protein [Bacillus velezensis]